MLGVPGAPGTEVDYHRRCRGVHTAAKLSIGLDVIQSRTESPPAGRDSGPAGQVSGPAERDTRPAKRDSPPAEFAIPPAGHDRRPVEHVSPASPHFSHSGGQPRL